MEMNEMVEKLEELPTLPTIVQELNRIIEDPMSSTSDIEKVMSNDQALVSRVLKLVNSAYYAIPGGVSSLARAVGYVGFDTVQQLVLCSTVIDALNTDKESQFNVPGFWLHSMGTAMAAETIAKHIQHQAHADLFTCGLMHDIGKMALLMIAPETLEKACTEAKEKSCTLFEAESNLGLVSHAEIGQLLAKKWQLPGKIQSTIRYHHEIKLEKRKNLSSEAHEMVDIVTLANLLIHAIKFGESGHSKVEGAPKPLLIRLNIDPVNLKDVVAEIKEALKSAEMFLSIIGGE